MKNKQISTLELTEIAVLLALVVSLQSISSFGVVNLCLCLVPITLGSVLLGWKRGGMLGFAFGVVAVFWGIVGKDAFTFFLFQANPIMTILICLVKGTMAGMIPAFAYDWLKKYNQLTASIVASVIAPVVNTGIFAIGCFLIKNDVLYSLTNIVPTEMAEQIIGMSFFAVVFGVVITSNFFIELVINLIFAPSLNKVTEVVKKRIQIRKV